MKRIICSLLFAALFLVYSTDLLDRNPLGKPSNEAFWRTEKDAMAAATGCYNGQFSMDKVIYADCASDNACNPFTRESWAVQAAGITTPTDPGYSYMGYGNMVRYNNFLENIHRPEINENLHKRLATEIHFLYAQDYFQKVIYYGDVPLVASVLEIKNINLPRTEKAKAVEFILNELKEIAPQLPESYPGSNVRHIIRGVVLALKARPELFEHQYDDCMVTCSGVMGLGYEPFPDYKGLFKITNENSPEVILDIQYVKSLYGNRILGVLPSASADGQCSINPTRSLVDAFECEDGKTIEKSEVYDPKEPYLHRDPRLAVTVLAPGNLCERKRRNPIDAKDPNGDYYAPYGRSKAEYLTRKYVNDLSDYADMWDCGINAIVMRYAEMLLMYAECRIELNQIDNPAYDTLGNICTRVKVSVVDRIQCTGQEKLHELLKRKRRVEPAVEGPRWFDTCCWKVGK